MRSGGGIGVQNAGTTLTWNGQITGVYGSFIKTGAGTLLLNSAMNNYAGGTYVEGGTLAVTTYGGFPAGTDVTVFAGGAFNPTSGFSAVLTMGTVYLNGGVLQLQQSSSKIQVTALNLTGGTVAGANANGTTLYLSDAAGMVSNSAAVTATVTLYDSYGGSTIENDYSGPTAIQVGIGTTPSGVDLDLYAPLSRAGTNPQFIKTGPGVLRLNDPNTTADFVVSNGKLRVDNLAALGSGALSLTGGSLQYGGATASTAKAVTLDAGASGIEVMQPGTTLTLTSPLTGGGGLAIRGAGTLVLPVGSTYAGGTTIDGITFAAGGDDTIFGAPTGPMSVINPACALGGLDDANSRGIRHL